MNFLVWPEASHYQIFFNFTLTIFFNQVHSTPLDSSRLYVARVGWYLPCWGQTTTSTSTSHTCTVCMSGAVHSTAVCTLGEGLMLRYNVARNALSYQARPSFSRLIYSKCNQKNSISSIKYRNCDISP